MGIEETKAALRKEMRSIRDNLSLRTRAEYERALQTRLLALPAIKKAKNIGVYSAFGSELNIDGAVRALRDLGTAPVISYPLIVSKTLMVYTTFTRDDNTDVLVNPKTLVTNIPKERMVDPRTLDVILVPGVAFDKHGHRLGNAGGYFDRYLPYIGPNCMTIGIAFDEQIAGEIPTTTHDRGVQYILTPSRLIAAER